MTSVAILAATTVAIVSVGAGARSTLVVAPRPVITVGRAPSRRRRWRRRPPDVGAADDVMAEWCEHVARGVRSGSSLRRAMADGGRAVPAAAPVFDPVLAALDRGRGLAQALAECDDDPSTPSGLVVGVVGSCADLGGPAAAPLDRTAAVLHARAAERHERITASAQARLSARVLTVLPFGTLALLAAAEPSTRTAIATPLGAVCLALGGLANVTGWWWMRRIIGCTT